MTENNKYSGMLAIGTMLRGTYRIDRYLASGGFGNTYVATNVNFGEVYAIKEFFLKGVSQRNGDSVTVSVNNSDNLNTFESQKRKFKKEAVRLRKLNNPHIVRVYDLFEENGTIYYVMDYIEGTSLRDVMSQLGGPMSEAEVFDILTQVLNALDEVHKQGVFHLDLKPANIMLNKQHVAIVIDFGASKQLSREDEASTSTGISFTNGYAPTEQMEKNLEKIGPWTDFYSLGATLYNLLSARKPPLPSDVLYDESPDKHMSLPMPPTVSQPMRNLVLWLMQGNRSKRPQNVKQIYAFINQNFGNNNQHVVNEPAPVGNNVADNQENEATVFETNLTGNNNQSDVHQPHDRPIHNLKDVPNPEPGPTPQPNPTPQPTVRQNDVDDEEEHSSNGHRLWLWVVLVVILIVIGFVAWSHIGSSKGNTSSADTTAVADTLDSAATVTHSVTAMKYKSPSNTYSWTGEVTADNVPTGRGTAVFTDGRTYKGEMKNGLMECKSGTFAFPNGDNYKGSFTNDHFNVGSYRVASDGSYFTGTFNKKGQPLKGKWYDKKGNIIQTVN